MRNVKLESRVAGRLAASCLAAVFVSVPAFAQPTAGEKITTDDANPAGSATPKTVVEASNVEQPGEAAAGAASDRAAETPAEKPADYWVPTLLGEMGGLFAPYFGLENKYPNAAECLVYFEEIQPPKLHFHS